MASPILIPDIVKHCTVAIYRDGGISGRSYRDKFIQSFTIAKAKLAQYGFISGGGGSLTESISLTPKGRKREAYHNREGRAKSVLFDTLYQKYDIDGSRAKAEKKLQEKAAEAIAAQADAKAPKKVPRGTPAKKPAPKPTRKNTI